MPANNRILWQSEIRKRAAAGSVIEPAIEAYLDHRYRDAARLLQYELKERQTPEAQYLLGKMLLEGFGGMRITPWRAFHLFTSAINADCPYAEASALTFVMNEDNYRFGYVDPNQICKPAVAEKTAAVRSQLEDLASHGDTEAVLCLADLVTGGNYENAVPDDIVELMRKAAVNGSTHCAHYLGAILIALMDKDAPSWKEGADWMNFAHQNGELRAAAAVGLLRLLDFQPGQDEDPIWRLLLQGAQTQDAATMSYLAWALETRKMARAPANVVWEWFEAAAVFGNAEAKYAAAQRCDPKSDKCLIPHPGKARYWYEEAARFGHPDARAFLEGQQGGKVAARH